MEFYSRIDIINQGSNTNSIKLIEYDRHTNVSYPDWFSNNDGIGCKIESNHAPLNFMIQCIKNGQLKVTLRGVDFRNINSERSKIYINFTQLTLNKETIMKNNKLIWHNTPYTYEKSCINNEVIYLELKFETIFDYFPELKVNIPEKINEKEINLIYEKISKYISIQKVLIKKFNITKK